MSSAQTELNSLSGSLDPFPEAEPVSSITDWDAVYAKRRLRDRIKDRRRERDQLLGNKRPKRSFVK